MCGSDKASLRLSAKQLAYLHCNTCHCQCFSRSDVSDSKLRGLLIAKPEPELTRPVATLATAPITAPAPATAKAAWGMKW